MKIVPLCLQPGGCVIRAIGTLSIAQLRLAGATEAMAIHSELEIFNNLSGTLSPEGAPRLSPSQAAGAP